MTTHKDPSPAHTLERFEQELEEHDSWFRHTAAEPHHQEAHGSTNAVGIALFMAGTLVATVAVSLIIYYWAFEPMVRRQVELVREMRPISTEYQSTRAEWERQLGGYEWVDPAAGTVRVPLDLARRLRLQEHLASGGAR